MNRIWISRDGPTSIREQLYIQLLFGIVNGRLGPSDRLPSVRDLARRLKIHPNTVSAAYQDLAARGWVKRKAGSGVFVCDAEKRGKGDGVDGFVYAWIEEGLSRKFSLEELSAAFAKAQAEIGAQGESRGLLVVHPDLNLARILAFEIQEAIGLPVLHSIPADAAQAPDYERLLLLTTPSGVAEVSKLKPEGFQVIPFKSVEELLAGLAQPSSPLLIGIVSRSETILKWASLLIPVLGMAGSDVIQRNPERPNWQDGLGACDVIAADMLAADELPKNLRHLVLRLIPDSFLEEARGFVTVKKA